MNISQIFFGISVENSDVSCLYGTSFAILCNGKPRRAGPGPIMRVWLTISRAGRINMKISQVFFGTSVYNGNVNCLYGTSFAAHASRHATELYNTGEICFHKHIEMPRGCDYRGNER